MPFRATLFDKSPKSNWLVVWHQDTALTICERIDAAGWGPWSTKAGVLYAHAPAAALERVVALRVCLDDSTSAPAGVAHRVRGHGSPGLRRQSGGGMTPLSIRERVDRRVGEESKRCAS